MQLIQVHQNPIELILSEGSSLNVSCSVTGMSSPNLYWYYWNKTAGLTLVFTSIATGSVNPPSYGQFKSHRPKQLQISLESDGVSEIESAVWYCAARTHSAPADAGCAASVRRAAARGPSDSRDSGSFPSILTEDLQLSHWCYSLIPVLASLERDSRNRRIRDRQQLVSFSSCDAA
ncbi:T cell receptor beta variable 30 [Clarias magur]|nr:T cell receptor beta variable 30 [Clarias magur]KAF5889569.1 T cell receptor beta variable 30 [Clarias magur]